MVQNSEEEKYCLNDDDDAGKSLVFIYPSIEICHIHRACLYSVGLGFRLCIVRSLSRKKKKINFSLFRYCSDFFLAL